MIRNDDRQPIRQNPCCSRPRAASNDLAGNSLQATVMDATVMDATVMDATVLLTAMQTPGGGAVPFSTLKCLACIYGVVSTVERRMLQQ